MFRALKTAFALSLLASSAFAQTPGPGAGPTTSNYGWQIPSIGGTSPTFNIQMSNGNAFSATLGGQHINLGTPNTAPSASISGAGCSIGAGSDDTTGTIVDSGASTCVLTFSKAFTAAPVCVTQGSLAATLPTSVPTTTTLTVIIAAASTVQYICIGS
jgi:hypothetical protein